MDKVTDFLPAIISVLFLVFVWFIIRRILSSISDKINNAELYKADTLSVLEEIRDELKELNRNNSSK